MEQEHAAQFSQNCKDPVNPLARANLKFRLQIEGFRILAAHDTKACRVSCRPNKTGNLQDCLFTSDLGSKM